MSDSQSISEEGLTPMDFSNEPRLYRMVVGAVGGQGGGDNLIISEMPHRSSADILIAQEINELMKYIERAKQDAWVITNEVRSLTPSEKSPGYIPQTSIEQQIEAAKKYLEKGTYVGIDGQKILEDNSLDPRSLNVVMMGMLCASSTLPISRESYLEAMALRFKGKVYDLNVKAFEVGEKYYLEGRYKERNKDFTWYDLSIDEIMHQSQATAIKHRRARAKLKLDKEIEPILYNLIDTYPKSVVKYILEGFGQLVDFQDLKHGNWYLDLVDSIFKIDNSKDKRMTKEFAQNMAGRILQWDGPYRIAEYTVHEKSKVPNSNQIYHMEKKLQPTLEEIVGMIPIPNFIYKKRPEFLYRFYDKRKFKGRSTNIKTTGFFGFGFFWFLSKFKRIRRTTVRFRREKIFVLKIMEDISNLHKLSPKLSEELCWYIGKIRGYSFVRHNHITVYHKVVEGTKQIFKEKDVNAAENF
ncbi:MAG: DUF6537 domain-containing protein, partial [Candidatus Kariarchaeaceae archaeon]